MSYLGLPIIQNWRPLSAKIRHGKWKMLPRCAIVRFGNRPVSSKYSEQTNKYIVYDSVL